MAMTVPQSHVSRPIAQPAIQRPKAAATSTTRPAPKAGLLSRIGQAVSEMLTGPVVTQTRASGMDRFQMQSQNYAVSAERNMNSLVLKGAAPAKPNQLDSKMIAWLNQEFSSPAPSRRI